MFDYVGPKDLLHEAIQVADKKCRLSVRDMLIRGILSGAFLGYATSLSLVVSSQGLPPIIGAILFPVGFAILVQLDGDSWRADGFLFALHGRKNYRHVAAHHDFLRPRLRALRGQYVRGALRHDARRGHFYRPMALLESAAGHVGESDCRGSVYRCRALPHLSRGSRAAHASPIWHFDTERPSSAFGGSGRRAADVI